MNKILFIDTETGGLDKDKHSLLTIGMCVYNGGRVTDRFYVDLKQDTYHVTVGALKVNNIKLEDLKTPYDVAIRQIISFIQRNFGNEKVVLGGHNLRFDLGFLTKFWKEATQTLSEYDRDRYSFNKIFDYHFVDTMCLCIALKDAGILNAKNVRLQTLSEYLGVEVGEFHNSLEDATATAMCYSKMIEKIKGGINGTQM